MHTSCCSSAIHGDVGAPVTHKPCCLHAAPVDTRAAASLYGLIQGTCTVHSSNACATRAQGWLLHDGTAQGRSGRRRHVAVHNHGNLFGHATEKPSHHAETRHMTNGRNIRCIQPVGSCRSLFPTVAVSEGCGTGTMRRRGDGDGEGWACRRKGFDMRTTSPCPSCLSRSPTAWVGPAGGSCAGAPRGAVGLAMRQCNVRAMRAALLTQRM